MTRSIVIQEFENFIRDKLSVIIRVLLKWLWVVLVCGGVLGTKSNNKIILSHNLVNNFPFLDTIARMEAMKMIVILAASP